MGVKFANDNVLFGPSDKVAFWCGALPPGCCGESNADLPASLEVGIPAVTEAGETCDCSPMVGNFVVDKWKEVGLTQFYKYELDEEIRICEGLDAFDVYRLVAMVTCSRSEGTVELGVRWESDEPADIVAEWRLYIWDYDCDLNAGESLPHYYSQGFGCMWWDASVTVETP